MNLLKKSEEGKFSYLIPRVARTSTKNLSNILASALPSVTRPLSSTGTIWPLLLILFPHNGLSVFQNLLLLQTSPNLAST